LNKLLTVKEEIRSLRCKRTRCQAFPTFPHWATWTPLYLCPTQ